jgi:hypothetical protein
MLGSFRGLLARLVGLSIAAVPAMGVSAEPQEPTDLLQAFIRLRGPLIEAIAARPKIIAAVAEQNALNRSLEEIQQIDADWQSQKELTPFKESLEANPAGQILRSFVTRATKMYAEALLTDNQGALVAAYPAPSDYWQGDEEKFQVPWSSGQLHVGRIRFDESTQVYASPVSVLVFDDAGSQIGVLVMGVRLSKGAAAAD